MVEHSEYPHESPRRGSDATAFAGDDGKIEGPRAHSDRTEEPSVRELPRVTEVPLKDIVPPDLPRWERTQHGHSRAELQQGLESLPEVRRRIAAGWNAERFALLRQAPSQTERELARTYDSYYGAHINRVRVSEASPGGRFVVDNGQHRVDLARSLGVESLPAEVTLLPRDDGEVARELESRPGEAWGGRREHGDWRAEWRRGEAARGHVEGRDFAVEYVLPHPEGGSVRLDYVDFREHRIVDHNPPGSGESGLKAAEADKKRQRRQVEAYEARFGRTPTYDHAPSPGTRYVFRA